MYAMATFAPRLDRPRDRQTTPPRSSKPLASNFFDGLLDNFLSPLVIGLWTIGSEEVAPEVIPSVASNPGGTYVEKNTNQ